MTQHAGQNDAARAPQSGAEPLLRWEPAAAAAARLTPAGPRLSARAARGVVESVRYQATASVDHVHRITGLAAAQNLHDSEVLVLDRAGWSRANAQTFSFLLNRLLAVGMAEQLEGLGALDRRLTSAGAALEMGGVLAFLSSKVLGQYDPFAALGGFGAPGGRLMLVAPNIAALEKELNLEPEDFRLWVCLHEQTHRVQFAAAPWLREHMLELMARLPQNLGGGGEELVSRILQGAGDAVRSMRGGKGKDAAPALEQETTPGGTRPVPANRFTALMDADSREVFSRLTAIMSLMEGHANVVMDAVDASIVPTVRTIRRRFDARPKKGLADQLLRKALGMDVKMRQYRDGQEFVRAVVAERGMDEFNRVWERAENLPSELEIHNPARWIARVLDGRADPALEAGASGGGR